MTNRIDPRTVRGDDHEIISRQAGHLDSPAVPLLHGASVPSFSIRDLVSPLTDRHHVLAPDYLGLALSDALPVNEFTDTFDLLTRSDA